MKQEREIKNIFALFFMKGRSILIGMIVGAIILGGYQAVTQYKLYKDPNNTAAVVEERYANALVAYDDQCAYLNKMIAYKQQQIQSVIYNNGKDLYMQLDANNTYSTRMVLAVVLSDNEDFEQTVRYSTTPTEYMISRVQNLYVFMWNGQNLGSEDAFQAYNSDDSGIRKVLAAWISDGGTLTIQAYAGSEEESKNLAYFVYDFFMDSESKVVEASFDHSLQLMSEQTVKRDASEILANQKDKEQAVYNIQAELDQLLKDKAAFEAPVKGAVLTKVKVITGVISGAAMGAGIGLVLMMIYAILVCIMAARVISSSEVENYTGLKFMGKINRKNAIGKRIGANIAEGKQWNNQDSSIKYIAHMIELHAAGKPVLLTSTCGIKEDDAVKTLVEVLKEGKVQVHFSNNVFNDVDALEYLKDGVAIFLMEKPAVSGLNVINGFHERLNETEASIKGFVLIDQ